MNEATYSGSLSRLLYRAILGTRYIGTKPISESLGGDRGYGIQRIFVINLDRHADRWRRMRRELSNLRDVSGRPLTGITRRFSAVDSRYFDGGLRLDKLDPYYTLADYLYVEPSFSLADNGNANATRIEMTRQESAVALSHIALWKLIASGNTRYSLVLEDDVYFRRGFVATLDSVWAELVERFEQSTTFDILYLSYLEARRGAAKAPISHSLFRPLRGLWQLSGYVLSRRGAQELLKLLPVYGPVDLWINHQFQKLEVFATDKSIIQQRLDCTSSNSYSVVPVLSKVGVLTQEEPLLVKERPLPGPIFGIGRPGTGPTALAMALSMLGYRCCSDIAELPESEHHALLAGTHNRIFNAYVNIGSLSPSVWARLATLYPRARFIVTVRDEEEFRERLGAPFPEGKRESFPYPEGLRSRKSNHVVRVPRKQKTLILPTRHSDKWELLCAFLGCDYPSDPFPETEDEPQRILYTYNTENMFAARRLKMDSSPWVVPQQNWNGIMLAGLDDHMDPAQSRDIVERFEDFDSSLWMVRDDTFPSNQALFTPKNLSIGADNVAQLTIREEPTSVREFTSASISSRPRYLYGRFVAELKSAGVLGLITGMFLHRNTPRQEIDIELLGKDPTKLLINVYYNPGIEGTRLEYGYRGTPVLIDLGFDASADFHVYEIDWYPTIIRWRVDGRLVYERNNWNPTPIPHLPMQFNVNLWHSRSTELAGKLVVGELPAQSYLKSLEVHSVPAGLPRDVSLIGR